MLDPKSHLNLKRVLANKEPRGGRPSSAPNTDILQPFAPPEGGWGGWGVGTKKRPRAAKPPARDNIRTGHFTPAVPGATCGQRGYKTPAILGVPPAQRGEQIRSNSQLHNPCRLGGPHVGKLPLPSWGTLAGGQIASIGLCENALKGGGPENPPDHYSP